MAQVTQGRFLMYATADYSVPPADEKPNTTNTSVPEALKTGKDYFS